MRKTPLAIGVATLLVALVVGACSLLNVTDGSVEVSAAQACDLMNTPYDTVVTASAATENLRIEMRDSGPDRHLVSTSTDGEGVLIGKGEIIIKDRTRYSRESVPDNPSVYGEWRVYGTDVPQSFPIPCVDTSSFETGAAGSSDEAHLMSERLLSEQEGAVRNEFWADSTGRPTRARRTIFPPEYDGVSNTEIGVMEFTYSGYGEPNNIQAPCASAAPHEANNPGLMRDCINLIAIKDTLRGAATLNWSVDTPISEWDGVRVQGSPSRVTRLELVEKNLSGTIPSEIVFLDALEWLWLGGNRLTGCIPPALRDVENHDLDRTNLQDCAPAP